MTPELLLALTLGLPLALAPGLCLGPQPYNAFALTPGLLSLLPATLQPLCLGRELKARVATSKDSRWLCVR